jgi:hypothetical protein
MIGTLFTSHAVQHGTEVPVSFLRGAAVLVVACQMSVFIHLAELLIWAAFFLWQGAMPNASSAYYFKLMQYTTVGSSLELPLRWRLLNGMLPIGGRMTFVWSTGALLMLARQFQSAQLSVIHTRVRAWRARRVT